MKEAVSGEGSHVKRMEKRGGGGVVEERRELCIY